MLWLMSISTMTFMFLEHPMSMGLILLIQTTMISMLTGIMGISTWFSYILFLTMVSGMLILFMYMTSVASNELFKHNNKLMMKMFMLSLLYFYFKTEKFMNYIIFNNNDSYKFEKQNNFSIILLKYLSFPNMLIWMILIIYLLVSMIAVVKITMLKYGPLRQLS
uniref:NADH-ubiquinone oxidoreductase chain 6 n=1 Tax=Diaphanes sp. FM11 TaxID=2596685 RepID=A0A5C0PXN7_9COLE|nr:NADH dehydrogenase subunit 6 [Diaphanes sp. FM11]